jgi:hypothetical protein
MRSAKHAQLHGRLRSELIMQQILAVYTGSCPGDLNMFDRTGSMAG